LKIQVLVDVDAVNGDAATMWAIASRDDVHKLDMRSSRK